MTTLTELKAQVTELGIPKEVIRSFGALTTKATYEAAINDHLSKQQSTEETTEETVIYLPSEKDFAATIAQSQTVEGVKEKCQSLVKKLETKYKVTTARKELTGYRKVIQTLHKFYEIQPELLKPRTFKSKETGELETENQSIALDFLIVSEDAAKVISQQAEEKTYKRANDETVIDCQKVFEFAEKLLESENEVEVAIACQAFTGRRISEIFLGEFVEDDSYTMIFKGQLKTRNTEKALSDYLIPVLFDSVKLEIALNRLHNCPNVKSLWQSENPPDLVDSRFGSRIREAFQNHFGVYFPKSPNSKEGNGSSHQLRALYASVLGHLYNKTSGKIDYIAKSLGDTVGQVNQYFRFDIANVPEIPLQLKIEEIGMIKTEVKNKTQTFDFERFTRLLSPEGLLNFNHKIKSGLPLEKVLAEAINNSAIVKPVPKESESLKTDHLKLAFETMLRYNNQCPEGQQIRIEPTSLGNVYSKIAGKRMFIGKIQDFMKANEMIIKAHHEGLGIPENQNFKLRNVAGGVTGIIENIYNLIIHNE
ncbi:telomere resolvase [Nostoc sp. CHAB 5834]|nr:telomere resolvase [Nostoc sp. CHAB 5834]